jgi:hypothetical protein
MVGENDASPLAGLGDDLVAENRSGRRSSQLLDVGPAEPAREHPHEPPGATRLGDFGDRGLPGVVEDDRAHGDHRMGAPVG